jgi:group I intron endonuclease
MTKIAGIYKIINIINGKIYIGSSSNIYVRINGHKSKLRTRKHSNKHLQSAWDKYGKDSFIFETVKQVNNLDLLVRFEQVYINKYNCVDLGYNKRRIADSNRGNVMSVLARKRMSIAKTGHKMHPNTRNAISKCYHSGMKGHNHTQKFKEQRSILSTLFWKTITPERKKEIYDKISKKRTGTKNPNAKFTEYARQRSTEIKYKPILQYDLQNNFIKEWQSGKEACINLNITHSHLSSVLKGYRNKTGGFKFCYKKEQVKLDKLLENPVEDNQQPIANLNG